MRETTRLRRPIEARELLVVPGAYDPISARLVERACLAPGSLAREYGPGRGAS